MSKPLYVPVPDHSKRNALLDENRALEKQIAAMERRGKDASRDERRQIDRDLRALLERKSVVAKKLRAADNEIEKQQKSNVAKARAKRYVAGRLV